jgi:NADH dehydrogenase [ubiquinone] 1 alpha subcomplex assembly factor 7
MNKDVFGASGDFTTSPEVSQMFGECIGIWIVMEWMKTGSPKPLNLVEFGPGRGTLMCDILRTLSRLAPNDVSSVTVHMVELSPFLTQVQEANLCGLSTARNKEQVKRSKYGAEVVWHEDISQVPQGSSLKLYKLPLKVKIKL